MLPVYKLVIDEESEGMDFLGLVDYPAHGKAWVTLAKQKQAKTDPTKKVYFNEEKRIVRGCAIATDLQIYRKSPSGEEYFVVFTKQDSEKILKRFAKKGYHNNVNLMHDMSRKADGVYLIEMFCINDDMSNTPEEFKGQNLRPGSIIFGYWAESDEAWKFIKEEAQGFSIEGWFKEVKVSFNSKKKAFAMISAVSKYDIEVIESDITIGTQLHYKPCGDSDAMPCKLGAGEYSYDGHKLMVDSNGIVVMIDGKIEMKILKRKTKMKKTSLMERLFGKTTPKKAAFDKKKKYAEGTTADGQTVKWDGALEEGNALFIVPTDGTDPILAAAGEYTITFEDAAWVVTTDENGLILSVAEGEEMEENEEAGEAMVAMKKDYEKKIEDLKAEHKTQLTAVATEVDELREAVEKLSEQKPDPKKIPAKGKLKVKVTNH